MGRNAVVSFLWMRGKMGEIYLYKIINRPKHWLFYTQGMDNQKSVIVRYFLSARIFCPQKSLQVLKLLLKILVEFRKNPKLNWNQDQNNGQEKLQNYCVSPQQVENRSQKVRFKKRMSRSWFAIFWNWLHLMKNPDKVGCEINLGIILLVYSFSCSLVEFSREICWAVGRIISLV